MLECEQVNQQVSKNKIIQCNRKNTNKEEREYESK